jgi:NADPH:quinone reductase-like Zn-dependent oxidoreductase
MKALVLTGTGGLEHLAIADVPEPAPPAAGEALVRIHSAALNRLDLFVADGLPGLALQYPHVVGSDGAGIVEAVGPGVSNVRPGDRVMIHPGISCGQCQACQMGEESLCSKLCVMGEHRSGTVAELVVLPAVNLAPVPPAMPWNQAAAFSLATLTAWRMLTTRAHLTAGEAVLIWGIGGGVAMASLQVAVLLGARTIVTSSSDRKLEVAAREGATATINHATADVPAEVKRLTGGLGADVVIDSVGEQTWQKSQRSLRRGGRLVVCGATTGPIVSIDLRRLFWHHWSLLGSTLGTRREYGEIVRLAHEGKLWPVVDLTVPLQDGRSAVERLYRGEQTGKLVIEVTS